MRFYDSITNVLAQIGGRGDKSAHSRYSGEQLDNEELLNAYRFAWLPRKVVDLPADDATREWRKWNDTAEINERIEAVERRLNLRDTVNKAVKNARLFGTSAILIHTNHGNLKNELRENEVVTRLELVEMPSNQAVLSRAPFSVSPGSGQIIKINNTPIHKSRLCIFKGAYVPYSDGGDSVLNSVYRALMDADSTSANINSLVFEAKIDVFKIPNLMDMIGDTDYQSRVMQRLSIANHGKSVVNALLMDAEEEYEQKSISFGGLNEVLLTALQIASGASGIPATKLLGQSVSGLNSTGDNEVRDYYDTISVTQNNEITPALSRLDELIKREAGSKADYEWRSLWQETNSEKAEIVSKLSSAVSSLAATMLFPDDVLTDAAAQLLGDYAPAIEVTDEY